ncbi:glycosyltransferase [Rhizobium sp. VS19-DR104.2]|uniref:glycosyltransferase n=1 Tax=unclassified Rhizobium TaxID=2613769 RepID=UPI001CC6C7DC|nr:MULTISPECIES: glycosyltransferase [unclassified Rhizobium]MBZ5762636.1 glycosyltransferase [Rhizobium sp. VS19-DR96]MBZ5768114.1 glycosyltransferase [Rhizobium sp. VS19-DR129.2]MBZ5775516.1 glycosyltransferase [Rhizobium sp. VS19-DRK62.2]MBZ5787366.1 glycosyltransferase [Rhizobium sp. VS19-DR121]MBZ5804040.1 glycosyltransferase [Rhizobium sp. VS19-DR181]
MSEEKLRVISIAHTGVSRAAGRLRYAPFEGRSDLDVHLVVPSRWKQFGRSLSADPGGDPGVTTHVLPILFPHAGPFSWYLHVYRGLGRLIRETQPHVIHLWEEPWSFIALQARMLKGDAALVLEVDQNILKRLPPPFEAIRKDVLGHTAHLLSRSSDATVVAQARGYRGPVSTIGYGVDQQVFRPMPATGDASGSSRLVLGYVGRLIEEKGIHDVLDAMALTKAPVLLKLMGEGPFEGELRARAERLGLSDRLTIRPWDNPEGVADFIRSLDALVLMTHMTPAVKEQFGRVIIEAQSCGVPVIGARSGAIPDVVGKGGWIVPERDPGAIAELLTHIHQNPQARFDKAVAGLENVRNSFTYEAIADQLHSAWKAAAAARRHR